MQPNSSTHYISYMFALKEGPKISENGLDYQLELLQVHTKELLLSPGRKSNHIPIGSPVFNRLLQVMPKAPLETILKDMVENEIIDTEAIEIIQSAGEIFNDFSGEKNG